MITHGAVMYCITYCQSLKSDFATWILEVMIMQDNNLKSLSVYLTSCLQLLVSLEKSGVNTNNVYLVSTKRSNLQE